MTDTTDETVPDIDTDEAHTFLDWLDPDASSFTFQAFADTEDAKQYDQSCRQAGEKPYFARVRTGSLKKHAAELSKLNTEGAGIFCTVNRTSGRGRKKTDVEAVRALFVDLDGAPVEPVYSWEVQPHVVVQTSPGKYHAYWLVEDVGLDEFSRLQHALALRFDGDTKVTDLPRVMRLPGFYHVKHDPFRSRVEQWSSHPRFAVDTVRDALTDWLDAVPEQQQGPSVGRTMQGVPELERLAEHDCDPQPDPRNPGKWFVLCPWHDEHSADGDGTDTCFYEAHTNGYAGAAFVCQHQHCAGRGINELRQALGLGPDTSGFAKKKNGQIAADSQDNIRLAAQRLGVTMAHDVFADRVEITRAGETKAFDDAEVDRLWLDIDAAFRFRPSKEFFRTVMTDLARRNWYHPVRDYLDALAWDGVNRLDSWLIDYGRAADTSFVRAAGALFLVAAVRRARRPGTKFDEILVLESSQGTMKSSALAALCPRQEWFSDDLPLDADSQRVIERTSGRWIIEASELAGMRKGQVEQVKAFASRQKDVARLAYGRTPVERPRHFVVAGTTNSASYLKDSTGNRRFWPVAVGTFDVDAIEHDRDQLLAEAAQREAGGASIRLPEELWAEAEQAQEGRRVRHPWEDRVEDALGDMPGMITVEDVWTLVGVAEPGRRGHADKQTLGEIMSRLGFTHGRRRMFGRRHYVYFRTDDAGNAPPVVIAHDESGRVVGARHAGQHVEDETSY